MLLLYAGQLDVDEIYTKGLSMIFTQNIGQLPNEVVFYSLHPSTVYILQDGSININGVRVSFNSKPKFITGDMPLITRFHYFGQNESISNIPTYKRVVLREVYPKIDAILTAGEKGTVEIQFIVYPNGNPEDIRLKIEGDVNGRRTVRISELRAYQGSESVNLSVDIRDGEMRFKVKNWDGRYTLVIDPIITAIVSSDTNDQAFDMTVDSNGDVFIVGWTDNYTRFSSSRTVLGYAGNRDAFVSKLSNDLSTHLSTAILASRYNDEAHSITLDEFNNVLVAGATATIAFAPSRKWFGLAGGINAFVSKLSNDLSTHIATAIVTSTGDDYAYGVAVDDSGNIFISGYTTNSDDFAPSRAVFGSPGGWKDAFVSKLSEDLQVHIATAILTSSGDDIAKDMVIDDSGNVFVVGYTTNSYNFAPSRIILGTQGWMDVFITKLSNSLARHIKTAILCSDDDDLAYSISLEGDRNIIVAGKTSRYFNFAPSRKVLGTPGTWDAFVSKLSKDVLAHKGTAILGSSSFDVAYSAVADIEGNILVVGATGNYADFAPSRNIYGIPGYSDAFITMLTYDLSDHIKTDILASSYYDYALSVSLDTLGVIFICGFTGNSLNFATNRVFFGYYGMLDAFIVRLSEFTNIREHTQRSLTSGVRLSGRSLIINIGVPSYVGFSIYDTRGNLIRRVSLGYLPSGTYTYDLNLTKGTYLIKLRIGDEIRVLKVPL